MNKLIALVAVFIASVSAVSAAEWKEINNRKNHLLGYKISEGDLFMQPVIVCKFDPEEEVNSTARQENTQKKYLTFKPHIGEVIARIECINVPSRKLDKKELAQFQKKSGNTAAVYGCPWYADFGLVEEPANKDGKYPFYYVVSAKGEVIYSGNNGVAANNAAMKDARAYVGEYDKLLGAYKPTVHTELVSKLQLGVSIEPIAKKLRPIAAGKSPSEAKTDAENILKVLDQSATYYFKLMKAAHDPAMKVMIGGEAAKTFPRKKDMYMSMVQKVMADPAIAKAVKMFQQIYAFKTKMPEKKADIAKGYKLVCNGEKACIKARKEYGDRLPYAFTSLENLVMEIKAEFEALGCGEKK
jgi:hypothetical protein